MTSPIQGFLSLSASLPASHTHPAGWNEPISVPSMGIAKHYNPITRTRVSSLAASLAASHTQPGGWTGPISVPSMCIAKH